MAAAIPAKRKWADVATVTLLVGKAKRAFHIHEADLFEASPVFKAAFTSDFRESSERTMTLPEDDDSIFELFVDWLYHQGIYLPSVPKPKNGYARCMPAVKLFVLADKYDVRNLKRLILSQMFLIIKHHKFRPELATMAYAYEHTPQNSAIRKIIADNLACEVDPASFQDVVNQTWLRNHPDISTDVNVSFAKHMLTRRSPFSGENPHVYMENERRSWN